MRWLFFVTIVEEFIRAQVFKPMDTAEILVLLYVSRVSP
jgi:hypothetical protein